MFACGYVHESKGIDVQNVPSLVELELQAVVRHLMWLLGTESVPSVRAVQAFTAESPV